MTNIRVAITKDFGNETLHVVLDSDVDKLEASLIEFDLLATQLRRYVDHYIDHFATYNPAPTMRDKKADWDYEVVECTRLVVKVEGGTVYPRLKGGKYEKYGIAVYPEILKRHNITADIIPIEGGLDMTGWIMHVGLNEVGKATKVVNLIAPK